jgi:hypothetical protein
MIKGFVRNISTRLGICLLKAGKEQSYTGKQKKRLIAGCCFHGDHLLGYQISDSPRQRDFSLRKDVCCQAELSGSLLISGLHN